MTSKGLTELPVYVQTLQKHETAHNAQIIFFFHPVDTYSTYGFFTVWQDKGI